MKSPSPSIMPPLSSGPFLIDIAVDAPLLEPLSYLPHPDFSIHRGDIVDVPLGKRSVTGFVLGPAESASKKVHDSEKKEIQYKSILNQQTQWPRLQDPYLQWLEWIAHYYIHPLGQVIKLALPPLEKQTKERKSKRPPVIPVDAAFAPSAKPTLTEEQHLCLQNIPLNAAFAVHLVHGVTGSGKTEIYLRLFEQCLQQNKKGLFLVPEISLTPQLVQRFAQRFGDQVAVLHSQLTDRERTNQWWEIVENKKQILIGARSALFCPLQNLGLIVVDEEHETSFKQDEKLKYHGRDCAVMLGKFSNCPVVLGSATPSLESWKNAQDGKYVLHTLKARVADRPLPQIHIVDLRQEKGLPERPSFLPHWLSNKLYTQITATLAKKEQVALLLNRRGLANIVTCERCGYTAECPNCDISLTLHAKNHLVCHYCDYHENWRLQCPDCSDGELKSLGLGTEKVEEDLQKLFPEARLARADRDEIQSRLEMEALVNNMEKGHIDILIGTQMIAKGLDFPNLNLVGLVLADIGFNLPDFRSTEKSFQLITQMSGRAGRHLKNKDSTGEVFIQTYNTNHDSLVYSQNHDYLGFVCNELNSRAPLHYPPFEKIISFRIHSSSQDQAQAALKIIKARAEKLKTLHQKRYADIFILGPAPAPLMRIKNTYRYHMLIKHKSAAILNQFSRQILSDQTWVPPKVKVIVDVDPMNLL